MLSFKPTFSLSFHFHQEAFEFLFPFCHKGGVVCISEVMDISPGNLDSSLYFFQSSFLIYTNQSLGQEDPLEEEMATHSSILLWEIPWTEEPGGATVYGVTKSQTRLK